MSEQKSIKAEELSKRLLPNLRTLRDKIVRKPPQYDPRWAKTISEAFTLYTNTRTIDYFVSLGDVLRYHNWPFPPFLDLEHEKTHSLRDLDIKILPFFRYRSLAMPLLNLDLTSWWQKKNVALEVDALMCRHFKRASRGVFDFWLKHPLLLSRRAYLNDLIKAYRKKLWNVCVPATFPLLDYLIRDYLRIKNLTTGIQTVAYAFDHAGITYEALKPGFGTSPNEKPNLQVKAIVGGAERDLRLPGIYLVSFVAFAREFYAVHHTANEPTSHALNRHAVLHGDTTRLSKADAVKLLMFFDLTLKLEPVLRILLAPPDSESSAL